MTIQSEFFIKKQELIHQAELLIDWINENRKEAADEVVGLELKVNNVTWTSDLQFLKQEKEANNERD